MTELHDRTGCLGFLLKMFGLKPPSGQSSTSLPYALRDDFLSDAELSFYKVLEQALRGHYVICPKVSLQDIFFVTAKDRSQHMSYLNKINRKHVDFIICDKMTMRPLCGVELDDTSHQRQDRIERDDFVNQLFKTAGLGLLRVNNRRAYTLHEVEILIKGALYKEQETSNSSHHTQTNEIERQPSFICRKCGSEMVLRVSQRGDRKGKSFYGCSNYPKCRETLDVVED